MTFSTFIRQRAEDVRVGDVIRLQGRYLVVRSAKGKTLVAALGDGFTIVEGMFFCEVLDPSTPVGLVLENNWIVLSTSPWALLSPDGKVVS